MARTFNYRPKWNREGILYTVDDEHDIFEPFIGEEFYEIDSDEGESYADTNDKKKVLSNIASKSPIQEKESPSNQPTQPQILKNSQQVWISLKLERAQHDQKFIWVP